MSGLAAGTALATLLGAGYSAYSSYEAGQQANAIAQRNAQVQAAQNQANLQASAQKSLQERDQNEKILASQRAQFAAAGVVTNAGSPLTVETKQAALLERKALNTDYEGSIAYRYGSSEEINDQMQGTAAKESGDLNAASSILGGAGNAASTYYKLGPGKTS